MKEYNLKINGNDYNVFVKIKNASEADVTVNGTAYKVEDIDTMVKPTATAKRSPLSQPVQQHNTTAPAPVAPKQSAASGGEVSIKSPLPGVILDIHIKEGDSVAIGQTLMVLEAMKMENNIDSDRAGVVKAVKVNRGDSVLEGDILITLG